MCAWRVRGVAKCCLRLVLLVVAALVLVSVGVGRKIPIIHVGGSMGVLSVLAPVASAVVSGLFNRRAARQSARSVESANEANIALQRESLEFQRQMAQHGIQWKVADAANAGLHPLYALS